MTIYLRWIILDILSAIKILNLYHSYKHYNLYKCTNCYSQYHIFITDTVSSESITELLSIKSIIFNLYVIIFTLSLYYLNNKSTRSISQFLMVTFNIKVSRLTVDNSINKFAPYLKLKVDKFKHQIDLQCNY